MSDKRQKTPSPKTTSAIELLPTALWVRIFEFSDAARQFPQPVSKLWQSLTNQADSQACKNSYLKCLQSETHATMGLQFDAYVRALRFKERYERASLRFPYHLLTKQIDMVSDPESGASAYRITCLIGPRRWMAFIKLGSLWPEPDCLYLPHVWYHARISRDASDTSPHRVVRGVYNGTRIRASLLRDRHHSTPCVFCISRPHLRCQNCLSTRTVVASSLIDVRDLHAHFIQQTVGADLSRPASASDQLRSEELFESLLG